MNTLMRIIGWTFLFLVFIASIVFSYANPEPVELSFGFFTFPAQPLAVWVIAAFVIGGVCGLVLGAGFMRGLRARLEIRRLRTQLEKSEQALAALRAQQDFTQN